MRTRERNFCKKGHWVPDIYAGIGHCLICAQEEREKQKEQESD